MIHLNAPETRVDRECPNRNNCGNGGKSGSDHGLRRFDNKNVKGIDNDINVI